MNFPVTIPSWENGVWSKEIFETREKFLEFLEPLFLEPGKYQFDETAFEFNAQARFFRKNNFYCAFPMRSKDYIKYWDSEKEKCRFGAIFRNNGKCWYLTREFYMWINFLQINDKEQKKFDFPSVRDVQYHLALYELLAELNFKHAAVLKKRQIASSYFHCAKLINYLWFEETPILKIGASLKDYINEKGSWKFFDEYKSFLDQHTAWYRPMNPNKVLAWRQQIEETKNGRKYHSGNKGVLQGVTFEKDPTNGVGGPCTIFFYEEAGIAPSMGTTVEFLFPAMRSGQITTGIFIAAGSVGDLDQCEPLKQMILHPKSNDIYSVKTNLLDDKWTTGETGLFIPEQWSMPPYIDEYGNSLVEQALESILKERESWKKDLGAEKYQLRVSQHPINIYEAFAHRKVSKFPLELIRAQKSRIEEKVYPYEFVELRRNLMTKNIEVFNTTKVPISDFPVKTNMEDKTGSIVVWERPIKDAPWGTYFASIDPISEGKTTTSESLCSIYIYKNPVEVTRIKGNNESDIETFIEKDAIVASWCGRFDDINKTHELLELLIQWYNAWTIVENNISLFINYMIYRNLQHYLVPKNQILFLKDLNSNNNVFQEYGWKNTGNIFRSHLLSYLIEFLKEEIDVTTSSDGKILKKTYGIERIPDAMALVEMEQYTDDLNVDRLVSLAALVAFAKVQQANIGYRKRVENLAPNELDNSKKLPIFTKNPFTNMGSFKTVKRNPYKNYK